MNRWTLALALAMATAHVSADTIVNVASVGGYVQQGGQLRIGMRSVGNSELPYQTVGGGFTVSCAGATANIDQQKASTFTAAGAHTVDVPNSGALGSYYIPGSENWATVIQHQCYSNLKGENKANGVTVSISLSGYGANFSLVGNATGYAVTTDQHAFQVAMPEPSCQTCCP